MIRVLLAVANSSPRINKVSTNDTHSFLWVIFLSGFIFDFLSFFYRMIKKKSVSSEPLRDFLSFLESSDNVTLVLCLIHTHNPPSPHAIPVSEALE